MKKIEVGDLLVPITDDAKSTWGRGVVMEARRLQWPDAHLVFWFGHGKNIIIEQEVVDMHFEVLDGEVQSSEECGTMPTGGN